MVVVVVVVSYNTHTHPFNGPFSGTTRKLNKEDAMDRCKWRKMIKDVR